MSHYITSLTFNEYFLQIDTKNNFNYWFICVLISLPLHLNYFLNNNRTPYYWYWKLHLKMYQSISLVNLQEVWMNNTEKHSSAQISYFFLLQSINCIEHRYWYRHRKVVFYYWAFCYNREKEVSFPSAVLSPNGREGHDWEVIYLRPSDSIPACHKPAMGQALGLYAAPFPDVWTVPESQV